MSTSTESKAKLHMQFAKMLLRSDKREKAVKHLQSALSLAPNLSAVCHFNLGNVYQGFRNEACDELARRHYKKAILDRPEMPEAWHNLGALLLRIGKNEEALRCFFSAIEFREDYSDAYYNVATALRRLGQQSRAIAFTWKSLGRYLERRDVGNARIALPPTLIDCKPDILISKTTTGNVVAEGETWDAPKLTVVCVKWGIKYGVDYVRNLRRGVRRHLRHPHTFICFTDDPESLRDVDGVIARSLAKGWTGWWNKATLFSPETRLKGRILYIDLDTVIVGSLDRLLDFRGRFATLATDDFLNEGRVGGLNSSVMLWWADPRASSESDICEIYKRLLRYETSSVRRFVHRFDHWLEMNLVRVPRLQDLYPGMFVEYANDCKGGKAPPSYSSVVNFPLQPKPHNAISHEWIRREWCGDAMRELGAAKGKGLCVEVPNTGDSGAACTGDENS